MQSPAWTASGTMCKSWLKRDEKWLRALNIQNSSLKHQRLHPAEPDPIWKAHKLNEVNDKGLGQRPSPLSHPACSKEKERRMGKRGRALLEEMVGRELSSRLFRLNLQRCGAYIIDGERLNSRSIYRSAQLYGMFFIPQTPLLGGASPHCGNRHSNPAQNNNPEASGFGFERRRMN